MAVVVIARKRRSPAGKSASFGYDHTSFSKELWTHSTSIAKFCQIKKATSISVALFLKILPA